MLHIFKLRFHEVSRRWVLLQHLPNLAIFLDPAYEIFHSNELLIADHTFELVLSRAHTSEDSIAQTLSQVEAIDGVENPDYHESKAEEGSQLEGKLSHTLGFHGHRLPELLLAGEGDTDLEGLRCAEDGACLLKEVLEVKRLLLVGV